MGADVEEEELEAQKIGFQTPEKTIENNNGRMNFNLHEFLVENYIGQG